MRDELYVLQEKEKLCKRILRICSIDLNVEEDTTGGLYFIF